ncbi:MAG: GDP-L-fucose synthase [Phycisphaerae bacterium]|nr:GDP-L-fucose synthase [Phycisphaerae bacterium]
MGLDLLQQVVAITGGAGFLGQAVARQLQAHGLQPGNANNPGRSGCYYIPRSREFDLRNDTDVQRFYDIYQPHLVIHLAASGGGIGANQANPGKFFYDNAMMGLLLMEHGRQRGLKKFVASGTVCSYPKFAPVPFRESQLWDGYPEETNAPYGLAKKMLIVQSAAYRQQYGFNAVVLLLANLYGPGDDFRRSSSHAQAAILRKCVEASFANQPSITLWGDGSATREFLYVDDAADGLVRAAQDYDSSEPVNLGNGQEISIRELAEKIARHCGFSGKIIWDISKPNGQPRRGLDTTQAREQFGFTAQTSLDDGILQTLKWYLQHRDEINLHDPV